MLSFREVTGQITDIRVSGDLLWKPGRTHGPSFPRRGSPMPDKGKYVHVWARSSDGSWKVIRYIVDSDAAP
jgi:ketosteroid isomerase-like protein